MVPRHEGKLVVTSRWLYKIKHVVDDNIEKFKAWFVARGFSHIEVFDYYDAFSLVTRYTSIWSLIYIVAEMDWQIHQMDVKTAFLNEVIEEEVYVVKSHGFEVLE